MSFGVRILVILLVAAMASAAGAQNCDQIEFRLWQDGENRFFGSHETATLIVGTDADLYMHVESRTPGQPYSTSAVIDAPSGRAVRARTQKDGDRARGRLKISGRDVGRSTIGYRLTALKSPGRLENVPERCRSGRVSIEVIEKVAVEPPAPPLADSVELCEREITDQLERDLGSGEGVILYRKGSYGGVSESFREDDPDLGDNRVGNDHVSSVRVPPACEVVLYEHQWYRGYWTLLERDVYSLEGSEVGNDAVSSLEVTCEQGDVRFRGEPEVTKLSSSEERVRGTVNYTTRNDRWRYEYTCRADVVNGLVLDASYYRR